MSRTPLLSILVIAGCACPSGLWAQTPGFAPYENSVVHLPPVEPFDRDPFPWFTPYDEQVIRLPPVDLLPQGAQAEALQTAAAELLDDGNQVIGLGLPGQPEILAPSMEALAPPSNGLPVIGVPPDLPEQPRSRCHWFKNLAGDIVMDYRNFYSLGSLAALGVGLGAGAAMANTPTDEKLRDFWQENVRCASTDEYLEAFHAPKILGEGIYMLPTYAGAVLVGMAFEEGSVGRGFGEWGLRSLRTFTVGGPLMLSLQYAIGASRPNADTGSGWHPFQDSHGVSGHAFMGAIPLLTAAKMVDSPFWKTVFYTTSTLPGISRINDDDHYASQVVLGWWIAYLAASAVDRTITDQMNLSIAPVAMPNGVGIGLVWRY